ncbi:MULTISPECIES: hypothetical protein [Mycetocola]|uniref:4-hydroxybenzoate polyprenyltransferase n=1 Tax=Mycetocola lacteus TaxID=76637 RepID=A0A3L7AP78_9MICO|nr:MULTISPECIES: hypothetical protein [Mycetocola]MCS4275952.1 hypothetical protein [Mycetocola sp. BIGb0189]RLP82279.1 hypothetical protein D9V34_10840 [Mycetocola lacteus]
MSISTILVSAAEAAHTELPMPPFMYGVVALVALAILGVTTFTYRDVANRHSQKPAAQPGAGSHH